MEYGVHRLAWGKHFDQNDLKTFLWQVEEAGAETVEMRSPDEALQGDRKKTVEIRKLAGEMGTQPLFCYGCPKGMDMRSFGLFIRQYVVEHLRRVAEAVYYLGSTEVGGILYSTWPADYQNDTVVPEVKYERTQYSLEYIRRVIPTAEDYYIQLSMEVTNRFESYIINMVQGGLGSIRQVGSDHCGLLLDVLHMNLGEDNALQAICCVKGHTGQFHVLEPNCQIPYQNKRINRQEIGRTLREIGYDGIVTMEAIVAFSDEASYNLRTWCNQTTDADMETRIAVVKAGLIFLRQQFESSELLEKIRTQFKKEDGQETATFSCCKKSLPDAALERVPGYAGRAAEKGEDPLPISPTDENRQADRKGRDNTTKFFINTANLAEIDEMVRAGIVDGITTNPSIIVREGKDLKETLLKICDMVEGPVNGKVLAPDADGMVREAQEITGQHENMVMKIPMTQESITAVSRLSGIEIKTNMTTVYDTAQALIVAKAGATYVSPSVEHSDDVLVDGPKMLEDIAGIYRIYHTETQIIAASMRIPIYVVGTAEAGTDIIMILYEYMKKMFWHPMIDVSLEGYMSDW